MQPPGQRRGSHREGCLPSEQNWDVLISGKISIYLEPYLEDGDGVVADHVGAGEGLGEEEEDKESHWKKDSPANLIVGQKKK